MILIEIPANPNCEAMERTFHEIELPRRVARVQLEREITQPRWYEVTGWTLANAPCPAVAQKVDDSGEGVAFLVHGGDAGLRFRPLETKKPWDMSDQEQWGEPFLIINKENELQFV